MKNGFSLVEFTVVLAIMATLASLATLEFRHFARKSEMERQVKMLYTELQSARAAAVFQKKPRAARLNPTVFSAYSSVATSGNPIAKRDLPYPVTINLTSQKIFFNQRGIATTPCSICISDSDNPAMFDSLVVSETRVQFGKRKRGYPCNTNYIIQF